MGSLDRAVLTGFICRLCSEMHRVVHHIYGEQGLRLCISEKISTYLSINGFYGSYCQNWTKFIWDHMDSTSLQIKKESSKLVLPVKIYEVSQSDPLPKTICNGCLERLENQHRLMMVMERASHMLKTRGGRGCGC